MSIKQIIIFGAGKIGVEAIDSYGSENVLCFVDNDPNKIGINRICGKPVIPFSRLLELHQEHVVVIASIHSAEMEKQLLAAGITNYAIFPRATERKLYAYLRKNIPENRRFRVALCGWGEDARKLLVMARNARLFIPCGIVDFKGDTTVECESIKNSDCDIIRLDDGSEPPDCVVISSPRNHLGRQAWLRKQLHGKNVTILNPYKMVSYYPETELVINNYRIPEGEAVNEKEIEIRNERMLASRKEGINSFVSEICDAVPLFQLIEIETINRCNGICDFCPVNKKVDPRSFHVMSRELFDNIIMQLSGMEYEGRMGLFSNNEPLLDERILEFSEFARKYVPKARIHMFTNGTLLTMDIFHRLLPQLDEMIIDNYHEGLELIRPVRDIHEYCKKHPELWPKVSIVLRKPKELLTSRGGMAPNREMKDMYGDISCALPFQQLVVRPTGEVSLCCNDALGKYTMGNLSNESILDVWYGSRFRETRNAIAKGRRNLLGCCNCDTFSLYL